MPVFLLLSVFLLAGSCSIPARTVGHAEDTPGVYREALWVSTDEITNSLRRERLIEYAVEKNVNTIYVSVYRPWYNDSGRLMYADRHVAAFIRRAHEKDMEVWASYGNGDWPELGAGEGSFPRARMLEIADFNSDHPSASFNGIILDVEPGEPVDLALLIAFYDEALALLSKNGIPAAAAIRYFWKDPVQLAGGERSLAAYAHVIDMPFEHVVVMGYRNYAGDPCVDNGLICLHQEQILYADRADRARSVLVGLRVTSVAVDSGHPIETFYGMPPTYFDAQKERVLSHFSQYASFGGFATHRYEPE